MKDICLGGDTVEKPVIFEGQEDVLLKKGGGKSKIRKLNCFNSAIEPPRYALSDFYRTAMRQFIDPSIESNVFAVPSPTHRGSINGRRLVPPVVRATPSDWGL